MVLKVSLSDRAEQTGMAQEEPGEIFLREREKNLSKHT